MHARTHVKNATPIIIFVEKIFVNERLITKITKILYHENLELYGIWHAALTKRIDISDSRAIVR